MNLSFLKVLQYFEVWRMLPLNCLPSQLSLILIAYSVTFSLCRASLQQPKFCPAVVRFRVGQAVKATLADHSEIGVVLDRLIIGKEEEIDLESLPRYMERENIPHHLHVSIMAAAPDRVLLNYPPQPGKQPLNLPSQLVNKSVINQLFIQFIYVQCRQLSHG